MPISKHEEKMITLRQNLSENQQDLQEFLADLDGWSEDIKKKDDALKKQKPVKEPVIPPVRNSLHKKKSKQKKKKAEPKEAKNGTGKKRISSYDYRSWDKFDVDKAVEDIESGSGTSSSEYETDEEWETERKKHLAEQEKEQGNESFKKGEYDRAIECYSRGIDLDPTNPLLPANRAMALLKQAKYAAAEMDCTTAITLDPLYIKAYLRRASARIGLQKLEEAKTDYQRILNLEPENKKAKIEVERIEKDLKRRVEQQPQASSFASSEAGIVMPIYKSPEQRSKKPLRRMIIEEIGMQDSLSQRVIIEQSELKKKRTAKDDEMFERFTSSMNTDSAMKCENRTSFSVNEGDIDEKGKSQDTTQSVNSWEMFQSEKESSSKRKEHSVTYSPPDCESRLSEDSNVKNENVKAVCLGPDTVMKSVPQNSFQFQSDYKVLKNNLHTFYQYFKRIDPSSLPKLFGQALDSDILVKIFTVLKDFYIPNNEDYLPCLQHLVHVKRFSMTVMFLSANDKQLLRELFNHLILSSTVTKQELESLAKQYEVSV